MPGFVFRTMLPVLFCLLLPAVALCAAPASARAADPTVLRFANFPGASTFPCVSMERWADALEEKTGGAVRVETYPGGTLLEAKNMMRGVLRGQADIGCISIAYHPGAFPFLSVFELPLGFASAEEAGRAMQAILEKHEPKELEKIKVIAVFSSPPSQILSTGPLAGPDDLKGLIMRASGVPADTAEALGASPVSMPQSDTPEALQKGVVQAVFTSFDVLKDYNFAESCRYGMKVDMPVYPMLFFMSRQKWDALDPELRTAMTDLMPEHSAWTGKYVDAHAAEALHWAEETYGYRLVEPDAAQKEEMKHKTAPVIEAWIGRAEARQVDGKALLEEVTAVMREMRGGDGRE